MAINLDCPRCKARLRVPNKKAGGYVNCPHCQGRFWVDKAAASDAAPLEKVTMAAPPAATPPNVAELAAKALNIPLRKSDAASPPREAISPTALPASPLPPPPPAAMTLPPMRMSPPAVPASPASNPTKPKTPAPAVNAPPQASPSAPPAAPPVVSRPGRKVARFISAEAAQSSLKLAADGKLPELHLIDGTQKIEPEKKTSSLSPLALVGILAASVLMCFAIIFLGDSTPAGNAEARDNAWKQIEANYFNDPGGGELKPYNRMLREAKRAHQSQDRKTERELLTQLRNLLRGERAVSQRGLTGSRERDKKLEEHVNLLLSGLKTE
jgi:hypothetical protein